MYTCISILGKHATSEVFVTPGFIIERNFLDSEGSKVKKVIFTKRKTLKLD